MKNSKSLIIGIVVVLVLAVGGYLLFHKSSPSTTTTNAYGATSTNTPSTTSSSSSSIVQTKTASNVGSYLADSSGAALYNYGADTTGVSNCSGGCLSAWPAYAPTSTSATLPANVTIITRSDSTKQYAYKGLPLYTFSGDSSGQVTGDGVNNFHVAKP